jgi:hypothetical protein
LASTLSGCSRNLSSNSLWKYVSVRRLFTFIERSMYEGTRWVVFETNVKSCARVAETIRLFLRSQWREGGLLARKVEEPFQNQGSCDTVLSLPVPCVGLAFRFRRTRQQFEMPLDRRMSVRKIQALGADK